MFVFFFEIFSCLLMPNTVFLAKIYPVPMIHISSSLFPNCFNPYPISIWIFRPPFAALLDPDHKIEKWKSSINYQSWFRSELDPNQILELIKVRKIDLFTEVKCHYGAAAGFKLVYSYVITEMEDNFALTDICMNICNFIASKSLDVVRLSGIQSISTAPRCFLLSLFLL